MDNLEKHWLREYVKKTIGLGYDMKNSVRKISLMGFNPSTIRKYYKALKHD